MARKALSVLAVVASIALSRELAAQPLLLQISPHAGDTLNVRMNQKVEMTGMPPGCVAHSARPRARAKLPDQTRTCEAATRQMTTVMEVFSRAIVRGSQHESALVTAVTDSIRTSVSSDGRPGAPVRAKAPSDEIDMRVAKDGRAEVIDAKASDELRAVFGQMPAVLSQNPVSPGDTWTREMRIPTPAETGSTGLVSATFQLDSLGHNGDIAYISMKGKLSHDRSDGNASEFSGWLTGTMQLDRRLGWLTDTRATIDATSSVKSPTGGEPMIVHTRVTQQLKAFRSR